MCNRTFHEMRIYSNCHFTPTEDDPQTINQQAVQKLVLAEPDSALSVKIIAYLNTQKFAQRIDLKNRPN